MTKLPAPKILFKNNFQDSGKPNSINLNKKIK